MKIKTTNILRKKLFASLFLAIAIFSSTTKPSYAIFGIGDIVIDPTNLIQNTISAIAEPITAFNEAASFVNNWILGPIADAMRLVQMTKSGNFIRNLVLGSVGSSNALLITNPQQYLVSEGKKAVVGNLNTVTKAQGFYSDSILSSVTNSVRSATDVKGELTSLSKSSIPSTLQKKICDADNLDIITELAGEDEPQDPQYSSRDEELFAKLCDGDPNTDPALEKVLADLNKSRPDLCGMDCLKEKMLGDNKFTKITRAENLIAAEQEKKVAAKSADLTMGNGIKSETECGPSNSLLEEDAAGNTFCPDGKETIIKNSSQLDQSLKAAIGSPLKLLSDSFGSKGIFALIGNIASLIGTVNTTMGAFQAVTTSGTPPTTTTVNGVTKTVYATSTYTHTLTPGTGQAKTLSDNIKKQAESHLSDLSKLGGVDGPYLNSINTYGSMLSQGKNCYNNLVSNFPEENIRGTFFASLGTNQQVKDALAFFNAESSTNTTLSNQISKEISGITVTQTLINDTTTKIAASDSIEEIQDLYTNYTSRVENENLPGATTAIQRVSDSAKFNDMVKIMTDAGGKIPTLAAQCTQIGQAEASVREGARSVN